MISLLKQLFGMVMTLIFSIPLLAQPLEQAIVNPLHQQTVQRAISWLENDMTQWREKRHCAACHHGPMYMWSMLEASKRGFVIDRTKLDDMTLWLLSKEARIYLDGENSGDDQARKSSADKMTMAMKGKNELSQPTISMLMAINALPANHSLRNQAWQKTVNHLEAAQNADGSYSGRDAWRPIFNTPSVLTLQVHLGLSSASADLKTDQVQRIEQSTQQFLKLNPVDLSQQSLALQLMHLRATDLSGMDPNRHSDLVKLLLELQRDNGGWSQTDDTLLRLMFD